MTIPEHLVPTVERALHAAFGTTTYDDVSRLGGLRAFACRIVVRGRPYVLRVGATTHIDPAVEIAMTRAAADAGIAPRVWHADAADRVIVTDFIEGVPPPAAFGAQLAQAIAQIHALPPWPRTLHQLDMLDGFLAKLRAAEALAGLDDVLDAYAQVAAHYPRGADLVACHNDLKAPNLLYDGARVWVIDWESAFVNDRYADLANAAGFFVEENDRDEAEFLAAYFGAPATAYQRARLVLARFVIHVGYVAFLTLVTARAGVPAQPTPDYRAFHDSIAAGTIDLSDAATKVRYANVHLAAARRALASPRLAAASAHIGLSLVLGPSPRA
jgi:aminoglycoside phosphotransferase